MKIERFLGGAVAADGGTISCRIMLHDGSELDLGLDCRIPTVRADRKIFIGAGYPTLPGARVLSRDTPEELEVINAIQDYLDRSCGFIREALMEASASTLNERDCADYMAIMLMQAILER